MSDVTYVILGTGMAGAKAVEALREDGVDGRIIMIGEEYELPYERLELSKGYLEGTKVRSDLSVHEDGWYARHEVELLLGRTATAVDPGSRTVRMDRAERIGYDRLLLATGSAVRRLEVSGAGLDGVLYLKQAVDADAIRSAIALGEPIAVIGAGWLGLEIASVACRAGVQVTLVEAATTPLAGMLGEVIGRRFSELHRAEGVQVVTGRTVIQVLGGAGSSGAGAVRGVKLDDGTVVDAGTVIVTIGMQPRTELAEFAGLPVHNGVLVDSSLRTENPRIWAAGDLAVVENSWDGGRLHVQLGTSASDQGSFAGLSMGGAEHSWCSAPHFWSQQYDNVVEYRGQADPQACELVVRDVDDGRWAAFWICEGKVSAAMQVNCPDAATTIEDLVTERASIDIDRLANPAIAWADTRAS